MAYYQQNMLSIQSRNILANLLAEVVILSEAIQSYREALANIPYFDCIGLFRLLDREQKGYLSQQDFQNVIGTTHRKLLTYAFSWFDNIKLGEISRLQFATFLLPKDNLQLRQLVAQRVERPQISYSQQETLDVQFRIFKEMLMEIINREMKMIELRRELMGNSDYSMRGVLFAIDCHDHDWICSEDIFKFMKNYGFDVNLRQVQKLAEVINCSIDGKITQQQLKWTVEGFQTKNKVYLNKIKACNKRQPPKKPVDFEKHFEDHKKKNKAELKQKEKKSEVQSQYQYLMEKFEIVEKEEKQIDQKLKKYEKQALDSNKKLCQKQLIAAKVKKQMIEMAKSKQREQLMKQYQMNQQLEQLMLENRKIQEEAERLRRLQNRMTVLNEADDIRKQTLLIEQKYNIGSISSHKYRLGDDSNIPAYSNRKYTYSGLPNYPKDVFNQAKNQQYNQESVNHNKYSNKAQSYTPVSKQNYGITDRYNYLGRDSSSISRHIEESDQYLNAAKGVRDSLKQKRDIQKIMHEEFLNKTYSKYGRSEKKNQIKRQNQFGNLPVETYQSRRRVPQSDEKAIKRQLNGKQQSKMFVNPTDANIDLTFNFDSPERRRHNQIGSLINKNTISTMNKSLY